MSTASADCGVVEAACPQVRCPASSAVAPAWRKCITLLLQLPQLAKLDLSNNPLNGPLVLDGGTGSNNATTLNYLAISNAGLSGQLPSNWQHLPQLQSLLLDGNALQGAIPASLSGLGNLQHLHLNKNQLTGTIPEAVYRLQNLLSLWLFDNALLGNISPSISRLSKLQSLQLQGNKLSGPIPAELARLRDLNQCFLAGQPSAHAASDDDNHFNCRSSALDTHHVCLAPRTATPGKTVMNAELPALAVCDPFVHNVWTNTSAPASGSSSSNHTLAAASTIVLVIGAIIVLPLFFSFFLVARARRNARAIESNYMLPEPTLDSLSRHAKPPPDARFATPVMVNRTAIVPTLARKQQPALLTSHLKKVATSPTSTTYTLPSPVTETPPPTAAARFVRRCSSGMLSIASLISRHSLARMAPVSHLCNRLGRLSISDISIDIDSDIDFSAVDAMRSATPHPCCDAPDHLDIAAPSAALVSHHGNSAPGTLLTPAVRTVSRIPSVASQGILSLYQDISHIEENNDVDDSIGGLADVSSLNL
ncbi:hypothetical protein RI367_005256 [Sorochytrium milnesiophthora]